MSATRIGTVEVLRLRVYPFHPDDPFGPDHTGADVVVEPGTYPLLLGADGRRYWVMQGRVSGGGFRRLGAGMFMVGPDDPDGPLVGHASKQFDADEWADLLNEPSFTEGHPEQRLRVRFDSEPAAALARTPQGEQQ